MPGKARDVPPTSIGRPAAVTMLPASEGAVEMATSYFAACGAGAQRSTSGTEGYVIAASGSGAIRAGSPGQRLRTERTGEYLPAVPPSFTARTRQ